MNRSWKIGILHDTARPGRGGHGTHLAFRGLPGVETVALVDSNCGGIGKKLAETGAKRHYAALDEMLECEKPDVIVCGSRVPEGRLDELEPVIRRGCHILCEKPLAATLEEADRLIALADEYGVKIAVAHLARHAQVFRTMKAMIEAGEIGRPLAFYGRGKEDERGGGEDFVVLGTHILDIGCFLFGAPEYVFADFTFGGRPLRSTDRCATSEPLGPVAGDELMAYYRFPNGVRGFFESRKNLASCGLRMGVTVAGTEGMLAVRYDDKRELRLCRSSLPPEDDTRFETVGLPPEPEIPGAEPLDPAKIGFMPYFAVNNRRAAWDLLRAVEENREPAASARDAQMVLEMIQGAYASQLAGGRAMAIPLTQRKHPLEA